MIRLRRWALAACLPGLCLMTACEDDPDDLGQFGISNQREEAGDGGEAEPDGGPAADEDAGG